MKRQILRSIESGNAVRTLRLVETEDTHARYLRAGNPEVSSASLLRYSLDSSYRIRSRAAESQNISCRLLTWLATDPHPDVRICVAENQNSPYSLVSLLASDQDDDVRLAIAENSSTPGSILLRLAEDPNPYVSCCAERTLKKALASTGIYTADVVLLKVSNHIPETVYQLRSAEGWFPSLTS